MARIGVPKWQLWPSRRCFSTSAFRFDKKADLEAHQKNVMARGLPKKRALPNVQHVVLVASGKGGVGKSTTAVNLALALSKQNKEVGIFDADIYGPSIPLMLNIRGLQPDLNQQKAMIPLQNYGLKCMSMGFLVKDSDSAVVWRGPMVMGATEKMLFQTDWGHLDFLVVDMPPGTGDIHLSIAQTLKVSGSVIVTTPQEVALIDAVKAVSMFRKVDIPVLGLVQNMSSFICGHCKNTTHIFGKDGASNLAKDIGVPILASVPLEPAVMQSADTGTPIVMANPESVSSSCYNDVAKSVIASLS